MPKKPKKDDQNKVEERWVEWSDLEAGVNLKAGHPVILFLGGHHTPAGTTTLAPGGHTTEAPAATTTAPPAEATTAPPSSGTTAPPSAGTTAPPSSGTTAPPPATTTNGHGDPTGAPAPSTTTTASGGEVPTTTTAAPATTTTAGQQTLKTQFGAEHFETAKAFPLPLPQAIDTFRKIAALANKDKNRQLLILGHTDTQGTDSYNLTLSDERAASIKSYLLNDNNAWYAFYSHSDPQKKWGVREDQYMLSALPYGAATPYYARDVNGASNAEYKQALKAFQGKVGEPATGTVNKATRLKLILAYMQAEGTTVPASTKIETQGCGLRNLKVQTGKNVANQDNRRVEVYAFAGAITPDASAWAGDNKGTYKAWEDSVAGDFEA